MTIHGRTTPRWGRDQSARWDSHEGNGYRSRSYPTVPAMQPDEHPGHQEIMLRGRPGAAETDLYVVLSSIVPQTDETGKTLTLSTVGWFKAGLSLNDRQARYLRDVLNAWFPADA